MEEDRNDIETDGTSTSPSKNTQDNDVNQTGGTSTSPSKNTQDNDGGDQLEEQSNSRDLAEPTEDDAKEEVQGSSKAENDTNRTDTGNDEGSAKSALTKKEERLKRLRELHLRRVRNCVCVCYKSNVIISFDLLCRTKLVS